MDDALKTPLVMEQAIADLISAFEPQLPTIVRELADLYGRKEPRISANEKERLRANLRRRLRRVLPVFRELEILRTSPESAQRAEQQKSALRSILIEMLAPPRIRKSPDSGRLEWLIQMVAKTTNLPRAAWARHTAYLEGRMHIWEFLIGLYTKCAVPVVHEAVDSWLDDGEYRRYAHSLRLLGVAATRARTGATQRITDRAAVEIQNEYLRSASLFEQQLRLFTCLARRMVGTVQPWSYWKKQNLKNLIEMASEHAVLAKLSQYIDRNVRNALTHGSPVIERSTRHCQFFDRDVSVTWTWEEHFRNTRALTLVVLGCSNFDNFRQLIEIQIFAKLLAAKQ